VNAHNKKALGGQERRNSGEEGSREVQPRKGKQEQGGLKKNSNLGGEDTAERWVSRKQIEDESHKSKRSGLRGPADKGNAIVRQKGGGRSATGLCQVLKDGHPKKKGQETTVGHQSATERGRVGRPHEIVHEHTRHIAELCGSR